MKLSAECESEQADLQNRVEILKKQMKFRKTFLSLAENYSLIGAVISPAVFSNS